MQRKTCGCCGESNLPTERSCWACSGQQFIVADPASEPTIQYSPVAYRTMSWDAPPAGIDWTSGISWRKAWFGAALAASAMVSALVGYHLARGGEVTHAAAPERAAYAAPASAEPAVDPSAWAQPAWNPYGYSPGTGGPAPLGATPGYAFAVQQPAPAAAMTLSRTASYAAAAPAPVVRVRTLPSARQAQPAAVTAPALTAPMPAAAPAAPSVAAPSVPPAPHIYRVKVSQPGTVVAAWRVDPVPAVPAPPPAVPEAQQGDEQSG